MTSSDHIASVLNAPWFLAIELVATTATAAASAMLARREGYSMFGTLLLAGLAAVGGGVLRDLLVGRHPPAALARPVYILTVIATVSACYAIIRIYRAAAAGPRSSARFCHSAFCLASRLHSETIGLVCDAAGLGAFTLVGVWVAFAYRCEPLWLWGPLLATLTTAGGGVLRDAVRADHASALLKTTLYAEISAIGGLGMTLAIEVFGGPGQEGLLITLIALLAVGCAIVRLMTHFHRIPAPRFEPKLRAAALLANAVVTPTRPANLDLRWQQTPGPNAHGAANARADSADAKLANPESILYPGAAAMSAGRPRSRRPW